MDWQRYSVRKAISEKKKKIEYNGETKIISCKKDVVVVVVVVVCVFACLWRGFIS